MSASKTVLLLLALSVTLSAPVVASAADNKSDAARELARRLQLANRKLEQEKAQLLREKTEAETRLQDELKTAAGKAGTAQRKAQTEGARADRLAGELEGLRTEKDKLAGKLGETEKRLAETVDRLRKEEGERKQLEAIAAQRKQSIEQCEALNVKLHAEGVMLLDKYRTKDCTDAMLQAEPFTGLKRVEIENFVEDSHDKLDELRVGTQIRR
jgi:chromosome segregation ATPase